MKAVQYSAHELTCVVELLKWDYTTMPSTALLYTTCLWQHRLCMHLFGSIMISVIVSGKKSKKKQWKWYCCFSANHASL